MANIGRPSDYIKKLEAQQIITRDMKLYTYLEKHNDTDLVNTSFFNDCELRRDYKDNSTNEIYLQEIEYAIENYKHLLITNNDEFFKYLKKRIQKEIIQDDTQLKYLYFLLYTYINGTFYTNVKKEDIYLDDFSTFEHISNQVKDHLKNSTNNAIETFKTIQLLSNKSVNMLKRKMVLSDIYNDDINTIFSNYIDYSLVHNESSKLNRDSHYLQIDLSSQDEDILKVINLMRKELKIKKKKKHKAIRDGLSLGEKRANMLFAYDCMILGLSQTYIREQIEYYIQSETREFILSNNKLEDYIKELKTYI